MRKQNSTRTVTVTVRGGREDPDTQGAWQRDLNQGKLGGVLKDEWGSVKGGGRGEGWPSAMGSWRVATFA